MMDCLLCRYVTVTVDNSGLTRFACIRCNKNFAQKSYIKEHMKIHTGMGRENKIGFRVIK
jgi:uncharacterized C2H2 Zn-finger protein